MLGVFVGNLRMEPRANVVTYDDENDIERLRYSESSSLLSLSEPLTLPIISRENRITLSTAAGLQPMPRRP